MQGTKMFLIKKPKTSVTLNQVLEKDFEIDKSLITNMQEET